MYRLTATYAHPEDPEAFVQHYRDVHAPLAAALPDLRSFTWGVCETLDGAKPAHILVAVLDWDSKESAVASFGSSAGEKVVADVATFAQAGAELEAHEVQKVV